MYASVRGISTPVGICSLLRDRGVVAEIAVLTDSLATIGRIQKKGLGKTKHLDTNCLFIQDMLKRGEFKLSEVATWPNPADMNTKPLAGEEIQRQSALMKLIQQGGRAMSAPATHSVASEVECRRL